MEKKYWMGIKFVLLSTRIHLINIAIADNISWIWRHMECRWSTIR